MAVNDHVDLGTFVEGVKKRNPGQPEFVQAVQEVAEDIFDFMTAVMTRAIQLTPCPMLKPSMVTGKPATRR